VNQAVVNLDQMTQQNAALVEESTAAAQSLREQAGQLAQAVAVFKVEAHGMALAAPMAYRAPAVGPMAAVPAKPAARVPAPKAAVRLAQPAPKAPAKPAAMAKAPAAAPRIAPAGSGDDWESF